MRIGRFAIAITKNAVVCMVAGAASASELTIYGKLHLSADYVNAGAGNQGAIASNASRIGFKGTQKINDRVKVIWQLESEIDVTGENGSLKARNRYLGVDSRYGSLIVGYHDTPFKDVSAMVGVFHDTIADRRSILGNGNGANAYDIRAKNMAMYSTPKTAGFRLHILRSAGEDTNPDGTDANPVLSVSGTYKSNSADAALAYERLNSLDAGGVRGAGGYKFGKAKVSAIYEQLNPHKAQDAKFDRNAYGASITYEFGKTSLNAQAFTANNYKGKNSSRGILYAAGTFYELDKNTEAYAVYAGINNSDNSSFVLAASGHGDNYTPAAPGDNVNAFSLGFIHHF